MSDPAIGAVMARHAAHLSEHPRVMKVERLSLGYAGRVVCWSLVLHYGAGISDEDGIQDALALHRLNYRVRAETGLEPATFTWRNTMRIATLTWYAVKGADV